jgi:putative FmdB family regulatory protein
MGVPTQEVGVPTYQYACTESACGHRFDVAQSFSDDPLTTCPQCEGRLRKVFSAVGVVFKGSGFYRTDSRTAANRSAETNGKASSTDKPAAAKSSSSSSSSGSSGTASSAASTTSSTKAAAS